MSHTTGKVIATCGQLIGYFEYNGTSDFAMSSIKLTYEEVSRDWRTDKAFAECRCDGPHIEVTLHSGYGSCSTLESTACLSCMAITGDTDFATYDTDCCDEGCIT